MKRNFAELKTRTFDLIVIGGGIIGTGIARDAALRGLNTLLVEKEDFACGTTSRSTRLIHGGLRYLRMLEFKLVWQDLHEREVLLRIAPHLVKKLEFTIPLLKSRPFYRFSLPPGLVLYDLMATGKSLPSRRHLSPKETLRVEPALGDTSGLAGSLIFYDCQAKNMERLCLENALSAASEGACILNYARAAGFLTEGNVVNGIRLHDCLTGEEHLARGRMVVNAAGPWVNQVWSLLDLRPKFHLRCTKGVHLLARKISEHALVLFAKSDGRLFFIIPWNGNSLIGTTDTDFTGDLERVSATEPDAAYLVNEIRNYFPGFKTEDIYYSMAGLRPLVSSGEKTGSNTSRAHRLIDHQHSDNLKGLISILGGKITAYRAIAEETTNLVCQKLKIDSRCTTADTLLPGAPGLSQADLHKITGEQNLPPETVTYLEGIYGSRIHEVLKLIENEPEMGRPIVRGYPDIRAQIRHAVSEEAALSVSDFMLRRSLLGLGATRGLEAVEVVARDMADLLGWNRTEEQKQIQEYLALVALGQKFRDKT